LSSVGEERSEVGGDRGGFVFELVPGEAGDGVAGGGQATVALAVVAEGRAGAVSFPAVELDDAAGVRPVAVDLVALGAEQDPVVEAG
jgi:hypothetical protein